MSASGIMHAAYLSIVALGSLTGRLGVNTSEGCCSAPSMAVSGTDICSGACLRERHRSTDWRARRALRPQAGSGPEMLS